MELELEGKRKEEEIGTSPIELNNATIPTEEEEKAAGIIDEPVAEVTTSEPEEGGEVEPELGLAEASTEKMFTQSQVDEIAGKARKEGRERALRETFSRYGVESEEGLDDLFGDAQRYATVKDLYDADKKAWGEQAQARDMELAEVKEKVALLESGIDKSRYDDAKFILRGKGLDVTTENILKELETHQEWKPVVAGEAFGNEEVSKHFVKKQEPATQINVLGNESEVVEEPTLSERDRAMSMFFRH